MSELAIKKDGCLVIVVNRWSSDMKLLENNALAIVAGGTRCECLSCKVGTSVPIGKNVYMWTRDYETRTQCINECCEKTGGAMYRYGSNGANC